MVILIKALQDVLAQSHGVVDRAVPRLVQMAQNDPALYHEMADPYMPGIARDLLNLQVRDVRRRVKVKAEAQFSDPPLPRTASGNINRPSHGERLREYGRSVLMFWQLPGGKYLKDANRGDLDAAIAHYSKQVQTETCYINFLRPLMRRVRTEAQRVGQMYTEDEINELWKAAGL